MDAKSPASMAGTNVKVDIRDLCFYYGATKALKNVSLPLYDRQVTAFIGPSGCGKSTLLRFSTASTSFIRTSAPKERSFSTAKTSSARSSTETCCVAASAWCFRSPRRFR